MSTKIDNIMCEGTGNSVVSTSTNSNGQLYVVCAQGDVWVASGTTSTSVQTKINEALASPRTMEFWTGLALILVFVLFLKLSWYATKFGWKMGIDFTRFGNKPNVPGNKGGKRV